MAAAAAARRKGALLHIAETQAEASVASRGDGEEATAAAAAADLMAALVGVVDFDAPAMAAGALVRSRIGVESVSTYQDTWLRWHHIGAHKGWEGARRRPATGDQAAQRGGAGLR
jgi:hypothetical protein